LLRHADLLHAALLLLAVLVVAVMMQPWSRRRRGATRRARPVDPALLGAALSERGKLELSEDRFDAAIALLEQALPLQRGADPRGLPPSITLDRLALANSQLGRHDRAIARSRCTRSRWRFVAATSPTTRRTPCTATARSATRCCARAPAPRRNR